MRHAIFFLALLLTSCAGSSLGEEYTCEAGMADVPIENGYPLVSVCSDAQCRPGDWILGESLLIPCPTGFDRASVRWME